MAYVSGDDTTIDFTTQTDFTGDTNPNGNEVAMYYAGAPASIPNLWLAGNRITVRGLDRLLGNNFEQGLWVTGNDCRVLACTTTGMTIRGDYGGGQRNLVGSPTPSDRNVFTGPVNILSHAGLNVVQGNRFHWGLRLTGDTFWGTCDDNRIGGPGVGEGNVLSGHGWTAEEGLPSGTELELAHARRTLVEGNFIGTDDRGMARYGGNTGAAGIGVDLGAAGTIIRGNTIGGIQRTGSNHYQGQRFGTAIAVAASASGTEISSNRIGVAVDGSTPIPNVAGIAVVSNPNGVPARTTLSANTIAHQETAGVRVLNNADGVRLTGNSIFENGGLGIDLGTAGVTPNDPLDADTGPNGLQNWPEPAAAWSNARATRATGTLRSAPSRLYTIDVFASPACDPSGSGEGQRPLGSFDITTDAAGQAAFDAELPAPTPAGWVIAATATLATSGATSEFSRCLPVAWSCPADITLDGFLDAFDYGAYITDFETGGPSADFNQDGFADFFDYTDFVAAFELGC
jgi:hypothetical protein